MATLGPRLAVSVANAQPAPAPIPGPAQPMQPPTQPFIPPPGSMPPPHSTILGWRCFRTSDFPDIDEAMRMRGAIEMARPLNIIARHVPPGAMANFVTGSAWGAAIVLCIKY